MLKKARNMQPAQVMRMVQDNKSMTLQMIQSVSDHPEIKNSSEQVRSFRKS